MRCASSSLYTPGLRIPAYVAAQAPLMLLRVHKKNLHSAMGLMLVCFHPCTLR
eukprot:TRINITY_DN8731_c0_g1_i1.p3 TRINITY_DN8731_c0_g1~~TRINITY_DN8731_c0_g1_i1.p3  ORF type:complete len:53 (+),score=13.91 TRINITY_DN8731_c0_g1_i1:161-319(+)